MSILDGNLYDTRFQEAGQELDDDLEASQLLLNNRQQPLLAPGGAAQHTSTGKVLVQLTVRSPSVLRTAGAARLRVCSSQAARAEGRLTGAEAVARLQPVSMMP